MFAPYLEGDPSVDVRAEALKVVLRGLEV